MREKEIWSRMNRGSWDSCMQIVLAEFSYDGGDI